MAAPAREETKFNLNFRTLLRAHKLGAIHIREADEVGVADLMIYAPPQGPLDFHSRFLGWVELKVGNNPLDTSQKDFLKKECLKDVRVYVARYHPASEQVAMFKGHYNRTAQEMDWLDLGSTRMHDHFDWYRSFVTGTFRFTV